MSFISKVLKSSVAVKAIDIAKREASKPQNQAKAKALFQKATNRGNKPRA